MKQKLDELSFEALNKYFLLMMSVGTLLFQVHVTLIYVSTEKSAVDFVYLKNVLSCFMSLAESPWPNQVYVTLWSVNEASGDGGYVLIQYISYMHVHAR